MAITRTDLKNRAATELGVLVSGQPLEPEDSATIEGLIDPLIEQLASDGVVYVGDIANIEPKFFLPLARLLANEAAPSFAQQRSEDIKLINEGLLRRLSASIATTEPLRVDYF